MGQCKVSYADTDGIIHSVQVDAESLYEAVAMAVAEFRDDKTIEKQPMFTTEFTVAVLRQPIEHHIKMHTVQEFVKPTTRGGPVEVIKREKLRKLLGQGS